MSFEDDAAAVVRRVLREEMPSLVRAAVRDELGSAAPESAWLSLEDAAQYAGTSPAWLRRMASAGRLDARRAGRCWRTTRTAVDALLNHKEGVIDLSAKAAELLGRGRG